MGYQIMANKPLDPNDPLKGKKSGKWTKYGGAVHGMVKESIQDKWYCQSCGEEQPEELKPFYKKFNTTTRSGLMIVILE
jgi:hypothetical protein